MNRLVCASCNSKLHINFRWTKEGDLKKILQLLGGLPKAGTKEYVNNFLVAECNGQIIACMGFEIHNKEYAVLRSLKVKKGFRRQGVATALFSKILHVLREQEVSYGIGFTLTKKMVNMVAKFNAIKISRKHALSHLDKSQPSELFDDHLSDKCQAWLFPIST